MHEEFKNVVNLTWVKVKNKGLIRYSINVCENCQEDLDCGLIVDLMVDHQKKDFNCEHIEEMKNHVINLTIIIQNNNRILPINKNKEELEEREKIRLYIDNFKCIVI